MAPARVLLLFLATCLFGDGWRVAPAFSTAPWCARVAEPGWPFAYNVGGAAQPKGRTASSLQHLGHKCGVRGARTKCHTCMRISCGARGDNEMCAMQLQGVDWPELPANVPTVTDVPFAVGPNVSHRYDFGNASRVCLLASGGACLRGDAPGDDYTACTVHCWGGGPGDGRAAPTGAGWGYSVVPRRGAPQGEVRTLAGGPGGGGALAMPQGVAAFDLGGALFVADMGLHAVLRVSMRTGAVEVFAGLRGGAGFGDGAALGGTARFSSPRGVAVAPAAAWCPAGGGGCAPVLLVADTNNHRIRRVALGAVDTVAGGGGAGVGDLETLPFGYRDATGTAALFDSPHALAVDGAGNVFVADTHNYAVRWVAPGSCAVVTLAGWSAWAPEAAAGRGVCGAVGDCRLGVAGDADGSARNGSARLRLPVAIAIGPGGAGAPYALYIADGSAVRALFSEAAAGPAGESLWGGLSPAGSGAPFNGSATASQVSALDTLITLAGGRAIGTEDGDGSVARFDAPRGLAVGGHGLVYVADGGRCRLRAVAPAVVEAGPPVGCEATLEALARPRSCGSYDPPLDALGRLQSPAVGATVYGGGEAGTNSSGVAWGGPMLGGSGSVQNVATVQGRLPLPVCTAVPPPDRGVASTGATAGPYSGTRSAAFFVTEDWDVGTTMLVNCPPGCTSGRFSRAIVYGGAPPPPGAPPGAARRYAAASQVCPAAVHAGVLDDARGGTVRVTLLRGVGPDGGEPAWADGLAGAPSASDAPGAPGSRAVSAAERTFAVEALAAPAGAGAMGVRTLAGAPAAPLDSACGVADGWPPAAARLAGPVGLALSVNASVPWGAGVAAPTQAPPPLTLFFADAAAGAIRYLTASCAAPCENGGACVGLGGGGACACARGWSGEFCTVPQCAVPCGLRQLCTAPDTCTCVPGYDGGDCAAPLCAQRCVHGACAAPDTCACEYGWFDANCTTPVCAATCGNGGNCTGPDTCACPASWAGADCRTPVCPQGCANGGVCAAPGTCACTPEWSGFSCERPVCQQGMFRADPWPSQLAGVLIPPPAPRMRDWAQFVPCDYRAWCNATAEFECLQDQFTVAPAALDDDFEATGFPAPPPVNACIPLELHPRARVPRFRIELAEGGASGYARLQPLAPYGWGPTPDAHAWSSPGPSSSDRQVALVTYARVAQGAYVCANGGNCSAPNTCICAPGWAGFDCRTPVCAQGFWFPGRVDARPAVAGQGTYRGSRRTLTVWESFPTPSGKFRGYMHTHPNYPGLPALDELAPFNSPYVRVDRFAGPPRAVAGVPNPALPGGFTGLDAVTEGWRLAPTMFLLREGGAWDGGWDRAVGLESEAYRRVCSAAPGKVAALWGWDCPPAGVADTLANYTPAPSFFDSAVVGGGRWVEAGGECVDTVLRGCFNGGTCVAPNTCTCAPGWEGDDCSLPICNFTTGTVWRGETSEFNATAPPDRYGRVPVYRTCANGGNCTRPNTCLCEKGWAGPDCTTPLCVQQCQNGGTCVAPDTCRCPQTPSQFVDKRGLPLFQQPDGTPALTGWTGFDCGTPICTQGAWVLNVNSSTVLTGGALLALLPSWARGAVVNDGTAFQAGCAGGAALTAGQFVKYGSRLADVGRAGAALCGVAAWWQGNFSQPWANGHALPPAVYTTGGGALSVSSGGRTVRVNHAGFIKRNDSSWVQGPPPIGEGVYACGNLGACVAPDTCRCEPGWGGFNCSVPQCNFTNAAGRWALGCRNGGVCYAPNTCACPAVPSQLFSVPAYARSVAPAQLAGYDVPPQGPTLPPPLTLSLPALATARLPRFSEWTALNGGGGVSSPSDCTMPACAQGRWNDTCAGVHPSLAANASAAAAAGRGCYVCANGGVCVAPDACACAPGWGGFDCNTPLCSLKLTARVIAQVPTRDETLLAALEQDPCNMARGWGNCTAPGVCTCTCRKRAARNAEGKTVTAPWQNPLGLVTLKQGWVLGTQDCLDGYEGAVGPDGNLVSCHLRIYVPSWAEANVDLLLGAGVGGLLGLLLLYFSVFELLKARANASREKKNRKKKKAKESDSATDGSFGTSGETGEVDTNTAGSTGEGGGAVGAGPFAGGAPAEEEWAQQEGAAPGGEAAEDAPAEGGTGEEATDEPK
jgi:hypothetical protein